MKFVAATCCSDVLQRFVAPCVPAFSTPHIIVTVEWGELGRWCELGQNFSESSPLLLLVKGHWWAMGQNFSAL